MQEENKSTGTMIIKYLIIVYSYHHKNTAKIANEFSKVLETSNLLFKDYIIFPIF